MKIVIDQRKGFFQIDGLQLEGDASDLCLTADYSGEVKLEVTFYPEELEFTDPRGTTLTYKNNQITITKAEELRKDSDEPS